MSENKSSALTAERKFTTSVEEANEYVENFDILETINNVGNDEVFTPLLCCNEILDLLPHEVWFNPNYKWLNPCDKNGVFLREIALRLDIGLKDLFPNEETRRKHILQKMLYSIGLTKFTSFVSRRTVYYCSTANRPFSKEEEGFAIGNGGWFCNVEGNILTPVSEHEFGKDEKCIFCRTSKIGKYTDPNQIEHYAYEFIHVREDQIEKHLQDRFFKGDREMKFDIIIGNPPYQLADGGNKASATPIYQLFVEQAKKLKPKYISMIIPSRWFSGGKGLEDFRKNMLNDHRISHLVDYPNANEAFPAVDLAGGVCYFLWDKEYKGDCHVTTVSGVKRKTSIRPLNESDVFVRHSEASDIIKKVQSHKESSLDRQISAQKPFGLRTYVKPKSEGDILLRYSGGIGPFTRSEVTIGTEWIDKWKVIISYLTYDHAGLSDKQGKRRILSTMEILPPGTICTETYLVAGTFTTRDDAENFVIFLKTKLVRFLIAQVASTQHISRSSFVFVPLLDFSKKWTHDLLCERYGLSEDDKLFIDSQISEME